MDFANLVGLTGVVQNALSRRGLASVDVRHDAKVAIVRNRVGARH
jgi:hypothetical protein